MPCMHLHTMHVFHVCPAVVQLLPNVVGRLVKLSVSLLDPTDVLEVLQDSSVASLMLVMFHLRPMVRDCVSNCLML